MCLREEDNARRSAVFHVFLWSVCSSASHPQYDLIKSLWCFSSLYLRGTRAKIPNHSFHPLIPTPFTFTQKAVLLSPATHLGHRSLETGYTHVFPSSRQYTFQIWGHSELLQKGDCCEDKSICLQFIHFIIHLNCSGNK